MHNSTAAAPFVLVHGAWVGAWCWREVEDLLRSAGHRVFAQDLTGLGGRSHLLSPDVDLSVHIRDVANLIEKERLDDVVLVGHSYGGMVISGVMAALGAERFRSIVYLDAFVPVDGQSLADIIGPEQAKGAFGGIDAAEVPPIMALCGEDQTWQRAFERSTPHPRKAFFERLGDLSERERATRKVYIHATNGPGAHNASAELLSEDPTWQFRTIDTGHMVMVEKPNETAELLRRAAE